MGAMKRKGQPRKRSRNRTAFLLGAGSLLDVTGQATYANAKKLYPTQPTGMDYTIRRMNAVMRSAPAPRLPHN